jgi:tetratricopeptide (TPR) repeat protein
MTVPGSPDPRQSYPGNPALSPDVRQRVESTYRQSLELARSGNREEASLGCDFVLQLDPDYTPAQDLLARLESGKPLAPPSSPAAGASGEAGGEGRLSRQAEAEALFGGLDDGGFGGDVEDGGDATVDLRDLPHHPAPNAPPPAGPDRPAGDDDADLAERLAALVAARRDGEAVALAQGHAERVAADPRLGELARVAAGRQEAATYVERFLASARQAREQGDDETARAHLDKARALDASHPGLAALEAAPAGGGAGTAFDRGAAPGVIQPAAGDDADADPFAALGGSDEARRIDDLLAEGQAAFDRDDHQAAIDAWSRIFLIDIENREAARRIEEARRLKAEQERRVEEVFHDAEEALARGDTAGAREGYEQVLGAQGSHVEARRRLDDLDGGGDGLSQAIGAAATAAGLGGAADATPGPGAGDEPLREEILVPPEPGEETAAGTAAAAVDSRRVAVVRESRAGLRFALIGTLVLLVVAAAGYLLWDNRASIFPNAEEAVAPAAQEDAIARATRLHRDGRTAMAINQLRRLPPAAPEYAEAQALISQWEAESAAQPPPAEAAEPAPDPAAAARQALVAEARDAIGRDDYLAALSRLEQAAELAPLDGEAAELQGAIERDLAPVARLVDLVRQGEHERALPDLWRRLEASSGDRVVRHLIVEAYYRMGMRDLQRGDAAAAAEHLAEAQRLAPDDPLLARHQRFAASYARREKDLQYRIYVKYLPPR